MGVCCGQVIDDQEILNANNINDIITIFNDRKDKFPEEKKQIQDYINVSGVDLELLKQRVPYLNDLENAYNTVIEHLSSNPNLPLNETKEKCSHITNLYLLTYDPDKQLDMEMQNFEEFIEKNKKK